MREILFRGKHSDNEWYYGSLIVGINGKAYISSNGEAYPTEVYTETVGQYTGLKDKNGVRVFEGDIINHYIKNSEIVKTYIVEWESRLSKFVGRYKGDEYFGKKYAYAELHEQLNYEVIGNVHDNPELLKGE